MGQKAEGSFFAHRAEILELARHFGARNLRLFGSVARGESGTDSDIDILAEFDPDRSLIDHYALSDAIESLVGVPIDLISERALHPLIRERVLRDARPL